MDCVTIKIIDSYFVLLWYYNYTHTTKKYNLLNTSLQLVRLYWFVDTDIKYQVKFYKSNKQLVWNKIDKQRYGSKKLFYQNIRQASLKHIIYFSTYDVFFIEKIHDINANWSYRYKISNITHYYSYHKT